MPKAGIKGPKNCYAVCVGISQYASSAQVGDLCYAESDAQAMYELLLRIGLTENDCKLFLGPEATLQAIYEALKTFVLSKPNKEDLVIFYFAGHGLPITIKGNKRSTRPGSEVFLVAHDFDRQRVMKERGEWLEYPLRMEHMSVRFFEETISEKVLFLFDSCYSGDFLGRRYRGEEQYDQKGAMHMSHAIAQAFGTRGAGRVAISSCLPYQRAIEDDKLRSGRFTSFLLKALAGDAPEAVRRDGWVTVGSLYDYLALMLPRGQRPVKGGIEFDAFGLVYYKKYDEDEIQAKVQSKEKENRYNRATLMPRWRTLLADFDHRSLHQSFMENCLRNFVGRDRELEEIHGQVAKLLLTGGYFIITGPVGQGKSSIIAKLVEDAGSEKTMHHFIMREPDQDYSVRLLRDLMAQLILKYNLSELCDPFERYIVGGSRLAARDFFPKVLASVIAKGGREAIFIDGLDLLKEDGNGERDLTFLPPHLPPGVVIVLGTRPNDTLRSLKLLNPCQEYRLQELSKEDFDLIMKHQSVFLGSGRSAQWYRALQGNALYVELAAKEIAERGVPSSLEELLKRLPDDPEGIFSLLMVRLRRQTLLWREVIKPALGILQDKREPLTENDFRQRLEVDHDWLKEGLERLGGLITIDEQGRYILYHPKLRDYLGRTVGI